MVTMKQNTLLIVVNLFMLKWRLLAIAAVLVFPAATLLHSPAGAQGIPGFEFGPEEEEEEQPGAAPAAAGAADNGAPEAAGAEPAGDLEFALPGAAADAAADETNEALAAALAEDVCDMIVLGRDSFNKPVVRKIRLLPQPIEIKPGEIYSFNKFQKTGSSKMPPLAGKRIEEVLYYEQRLLNQAASVLAVEPSRLTSAPQPPDIFFTTDAHRADVATAVAILKKALAEHRSAAQRLVRVGPAWETKFRRPLLQALFNIRYRQAQWLFNQQRNAEALALCDQLRETLGAGSPVHLKMKAIFEELLLTPAEQAEAAGQFETSRQNLSGFLTRFGVQLQDENSRAMQLRRRLMQHAGEIARSAATAATLREQREKLALAESVWPGHRDIDTARQQLDLQQQSLEVAYQVLPQSLSPFAVRSDSERHAHHLQFEGLVQWRRDSSPGPHYQPQLAVGRPVPLAKGRRFHLPDISWSDNTRQVLAEDVEWSYQIFSKLQPPGYPKAWSNMIVDIRTRERAAVEIMLAADF